MRKKTLMIFFLGFLLFYQPLIAQTWGAAKRLTWNSGNSSNPAISTDSSNNIHVVWDDDTPGNSEIYYKKSTDGGASWITRCLTWSYDISFYPAIAVDTNNHIHVVWVEHTPAGNYEIFYKNSTNGGTSWTTKRLTFNSGSSQFPAIAIDPNNDIHVVWMDDTPGNIEIYYKSSTDSGVTWDGVKRLTWTAEYSIYPEITTDMSNNIHVIWLENKGGIFEEDYIFYKKSTDGGTTWTQKRLTWRATWGIYLTITTDMSNNIHVVWEQSIPYIGTMIFYKKSTDGGLSWTNKRLTWTPFSFEPVVVTDTSNNIHVIWSRESFDLGSSEIFHKKSTDGGINWATKRLTWNSGNSGDPAIVVDSAGNIHVVWRDSTPGNSEIYYKKGIQ